MQSKILSYRINNDINMLKELLSDHNLNFIEFWQHIAHTYDVNHQIKLICQCLVNNTCLFKLAFEIMQPSVFELEKGLGNLATKVCEVGNIELLKYLAEVTHFNMSSTPVMAIACYRNDLEMAKFSLTLKKTNYFTSYEGKYAITYATEHNNLAMIKFLIANVPQSDRYIGYVTDEKIMELFTIDENSLLIACYCNNWHLVNYIKNKGLLERFFKEDPFKYMRHIACIKDLIIFEIFLPMITDINMIDEKGYNLLYSACYENNLPLIKRLVELGVDYNHLSNNNESLLYLVILKIYSFSSNLHQIIKYLCDLPEINILHSKKRNIWIYYLHMHQKTDLNKFFMNTAIIGRINDVDKNFSILAYTCMYGDLHDVKLLLSHQSINVNIVNQIAYSTIDSKIIYELIMDVRYDFSHPDNNLLLHLIINNIPNEEVGYIDYVIWKNIQLVNSIDKFGNIPFITACQLKKQSMAMYLLFVTPEDKFSGSDKTGVGYCNFVSAEIMKHFLAVSDVKHKWNDKYLSEPYMQEYLKNPSRIRNKLRQQFHIDTIKSSKLFALIIYNTDNYFSLRNLNTEQVRFFKIASKLPIELQMLLANRTFGVAHDIIHLDNRLASFRYVLSYL